MLPVFVRGQLSMEALSASLEKLQAAVNARGAGCDARGGLQPGVEIVEWVGRKGGICLSTPPRTSVVDDMQRTQASSAPFSPWRERRNRSSARRQTFVVDWGPFPLFPVDNTGFGGDLLDDIGLGSKSKVFMNALLKLGLAKLHVTPGQATSYVLL